MTTVEHQEDGRVYTITVEYEVYDYVDGTKSIIALCEGHRSECGKISPVKYEDSDQVLCFSAEIGHLNLGLFLEEDNAVEAVMKKMSEIIANELMVSVERALDWARTSEEEDE